MLNSYALKLQDQLFPHNSSVVESLGTRLAVCSKLQDPSSCRSFPHFVRSVRDQRRESHLRAGQSNSTPSPPLTHTPLTHTHTRIPRSLSHVLHVYTHTHTQGLKPRTAIKPGNEDSRINSVLHVGLYVR